MKSSWIGIGFSHHSVPSLSNTATRSSAGTPSAMVCSTNSTIVLRATPSRHLDSAVMAVLPPSSGSVPTQRRVGCRRAGLRAHQGGRVRGRSGEICRLTVSMMETGNHEPGPEATQLLLILLARRHQGGRVDPEQVLLPD